MLLHHSPVPIQVVSDAGSDVGLQLTKHTSTFHMAQVSHQLPWSEEEEKVQGRRLGGGGGSRKEGRRRRLKEGGEEEEGRRKEGRTGNSEHKLTQKSFAMTRH